MTGYIPIMTRFTLILSCLLLSQPAVAQEEDRFEGFFQKLEELSNEAQGLLEGWMEDFGPRLEELAPLFEDLADKLGDISAYHPPEVLPNGDIIIRRKTPLPPPDPDDPPADSGPIDL